MAEDSSLKSVILFLVLIFAISLPGLIGSLINFQDMNPAFISLIFLVLAIIISYPIIRFVFPDYPDHTIWSIATILGYIAGHTSVFEIQKTLPSVGVYAIFIFLFYFHFSSEEIKLLEKK